MKYLLLLTLIVGCKARSTLDNGFNKNVYGESIRYCEVPLKISTTGLDERTIASVIYAISEWNNKFGKILFAATTDTKNSVINVFNWDRSIKYQAITSARWADSCIYQVNVYVNNRDFTYYRTGERQSGYNLDALMLHELGHTLGLVDNDIPTSVMYRYLAIQENRTKASEYDLTNLRSVYK